MTQHSQELSPEAFRFSPISPELVEDFYERARHWQQVIDDTSDQGQLGTVIENAKAELNSKYPFKGEPMMVSGNGLMPIISGDGSYLGQQWVNQEVRGWCQSVRVLSLNTRDQELKPRLTHMVMLDEQAYHIAATVERTDVLYGFFDLSSTLTSTMEVEEALGALSKGEDLMSEELLAIMKSFSDDMVQIIRSSKFRRLKHQDQIELLDELVSEIEQQTAIRDMLVLAEPEHIYVNDNRENEMQLLKINTDFCIIGGICLGLFVLENPGLQSKPIRKPRDIFNKTAGLCLVLAPDVDTVEGLGLSDNQAIYLPLSSQDTKAEFER